jgi:hypothetical protein
MSSAQERALLVSLGLLPAEDASDTAEGSEQAKEPDFDGGVRETPELSVDPEREHNDAIAQMIQAERQQRYGA